MNDGELFAFVDVFRGVQRVFGKRVQDHEEGQMHRDYFKALRRFTIDQVKAGAEAWTQRGKYFPKPAEWIDAIPRREAPTVNVPALSEQDARDYARAEQLRYEGSPCTCRECVQAGMAERATRFVPEFVDDHARLVRFGERIVTAGHWAHGFELARWYQARADFYNKFLERFGGLPKMDGAA